MPSSAFGRAFANNAEGEAIDVDDGTSDAGLDMLATLALSLGALLLGSPSPLASAAELEPTQLSSARCTQTVVLTITLDDGTVHGLAADGSLQATPSVETADCASSDPSPNAEHPTPLGSKLFTYSSRTYSKTDSNVIFDAQYTPGTNHTVAMGIKLTAALRAIITSTAITFSASRTPTGNCNPALPI